MPKPTAADANDPTSLEAALQALKTMPQGAVIASISDGIKTLTPEDVAALSKQGAKAIEASLLESSREWMRKKI